MRTVHIALLFLCASGCVTSPSGVGGACSADTECVAEAFCSYAGLDSCGASGNDGVCAERPTTCEDDGPPVCGCDRIAYANRCEAHRAGTGARGAPNASGMCPCGSDDECPAGERCVPCLSDVRVCVPAGVIC